MSSKINLQTCEYARKSSIFQDNQLISYKQRDISDTQYNNIQNGSLKMEKDQHRLMKKLLIASMQK